MAKQLVQEYSEIEMGKALGVLHLIWALQMLSVLSLLELSLAVECAVDRNCKFLWIETDSRLATLEVKSPHMVPWQLNNKWLNYIHMMSTMSYFVTHI